VESLATTDCGKKYDFTSTINLFYAKLVNMQDWTEEHLMGVDELETVGRRKAASSFAEQTVLEVALSFPPDDDGSEQERQEYSLITNAIQSVVDECLSTPTACVSSDQLHSLENIISDCGIIDEYKCYMCFKNTCVEY
jgi:hypothetical protein